MEEFKPSYIQMEYTGHGFMQDNDPKHTSRLTMDCNEKRLIDGEIQTIIYTDGIYRTWFHAGQ